MTAPALSPEERAAGELLVVLPPVRGRGLRHYVASTGGRTLCGRDANMWKIDIKGGSAGCFRCLKAAAVRARAARREAP